MATAEFSKFVGIVSTALSQHHLLGFEVAQLEFTEKAMATYSSVLAWRIPGTGEPDGLPFPSPMNESDK